MSGDASRENWKSKLSVVGEWAKLLALQWLVYFPLQAASRLWGAIVELYYVAPRALGTVALVLSFFVPYLLDSPFEFALGTVGLYFSLRVIFGRHWRAKAGLHLNSREVLSSAALLVVMYFGAEFAVSSLLGRIDGRTVASSPIVHPTVWGMWAWKFSPFFQALNEEIVLRALLLGLLFRIVDLPVLVCSVTGVLLAVAQLFFFEMGFAGGGADFSFLLLVNLSLFGILCNLLFLWSGHIGFGVALHAGWYLVRSTSQYSVGGRTLSAAQSANLIEGSWAMLVLLTLLLLISIAFVMPSRRDTAFRAHRRTLF